VDRLLARAIRKNWWLAGGVACALALAGRAQEATVVGALLLAWNLVLMAVQTRLGRRGRDAAAARDTGGRSGCRSR
jgi:4-amino-4-deoxy-L-arabinose transferase-like glycosyltransferase